MKPELGCLGVSLDVSVWRLVIVACAKEKPIRAASEYSRHEDRVACLASVRAVLGRTWLRIGSTNSSKRDKCRNPRNWALEGVSLSPVRSTANLLPISVMRSACDSLIALVTDRSFAFSSSEYGDLRDKNLRSSLRPNTMKSSRSSYSPLLMKSRTSRRIAALFENWLSALILLLTGSIALDCERHRVSAA